MRKTLYLLVFVLALALACATSQTSTSSPAPTQTQRSKTTDQTTPPATPGTGTPSATPSAPDMQSTPDTSTAVSGSELQGQIQNALKNEPTLANANVSVSVTDDEIDLSGTVANAKERLTAKRIAQSYAGNRKVKDRMTVGGQK